MIIRPLFFFCRGCDSIWDEIPHSKRVSYAPLTAEGILINCTGVAVASLSLLIVYIATRWQYKRQPLPEDELLLADQLAE
jgi:hypothetical protein